MLAGLGAAAALWSACLAAPRSALGAASGTPRITLAVLPGDTTYNVLGAVDGISPGALSAGLGTVPAAQTFLDISQGNRLFGSLYDRPLPALIVVDGRVPPPLWGAVTERAHDAPADLEPGLLATTIRSSAPRSGPAPVAVADRLAGLAGLAAVDEQGRVPGDAGCPAAGCRGLDVVASDLRGLPALVRRLRGDDMLIALERPPPESDHLLALGIAGRGFDGMLTSDSTRTPGLVLSTDIAPTILERLGIAIPEAMSGSPITTEGEPDAAKVASLEDRLMEVGPRRGPVIGTNVLIWLALALLAAGLWWPGGARVALSLLALAAIYVPAVLLLTAALEPSEWVERLVVGLGAPLLAALTLRVLRGYAAIAAACAITVGAYAIDVVAGSPLTPLSLMGSNPLIGVRFYGIGNELEATLAPLVLLGAGAGIAAWMPVAGTLGATPGPSPDGRRAALTFALVSLLAIVAFAPGRFGADVGAAIVLAVGGGVAAAVALGATRRRTVLLVLAAPIVVLAALAASDLVLGGNAHLTRSVLEAGGLDQVGQVAERRLRLSAASFSTTFGSPFLFAALAGIVAGIVLRRRIAALLASPRAVLAGFLGAVTAVVVGTLVNDSGVLLLMVGTAYLALFVGYVWASSSTAAAR